MEFEIIEINNTYKIMVLGILDIYCESSMN